MFFGDGLIDPDFGGRIVLVDQIRCDHGAAVRKSSVHHRQVKRICKHLSLSIAAVRKLDFLCDGTVIIILGLGHFDLKRYDLIETKTIQTVCKPVCSKFEGCLCKEDIV